MRPFPLFTVWAMSALVAFQFAAGQATDPLVEVLLKKGVISKGDFRGEALTREALLDVLVRKGVLSDEEGLLLKAQEQKEYATKQDVAAAKQEVEALVRQDAGGPGMPSWIEGLTIKGDIRARLEGFDFDGGDHPDDKQRNRGRVRARLAISKEWDNGLKAGLRLATGSLDDPISTNQSFDDASANKNLNLDRAYISYSPEMVEWLNVTAGRMANPFEHTSMVWDGDLNFEGLAEKVSVPLTEDLEVFANLGQFVLNESSSGTDSLLWAWQAGVGADPTDALGGTLAVAYYSYQNADDDADLTTLATDAGNSGGAGDLTFKYRIVDIVAKAKTEVAELPLGVWVDFAWNVADDAASTNLDENFAWGVGATLGKCKKQGSWEIGAEYKRIEADAVLAAYNDSDFLGTNRKGFKVGGGYQVLDNLTLNLTVFFTENIDEALNTADQDYTRWQLDALVKF